MQDQDLIARVYAVAQHAGLANEAIKSSIHYVRPQEQQHPPRATAYNSREPTPAPEECDDTLLPDVDGPYLELRFSRIPRSSHGFIFGRHPSSDVVLPDEPGISHFQCSITFDHERRLIVKDADTSTEQCSFFTEANYENGSYLAPAHQSHLELLGAVHPVEGLGKMSTASSGYGIGSCDSGFEFAEFLTEA